MLEILSPPCARANRPRWKMPSYLEALFFDARRYDVSKVGRYKFSQKMDIWSRLCGQLLAEPVADPMTGGILAMPSLKSFRERRADLCARRQQAIVDVNSTRVKVFSMVWSIWPICGL